mgnify:CR=1 FL=1
MIRVKGKTVVPGIAVGTVRLLMPPSAVRRIAIDDPAAEKERVARAVETAQAQLATLYDRAMRDAGEEVAAIFEIHQMMLEDEDYRAAIDDLIDGERVNAEYAVAQTGEQFSRTFAQMDDEYMKERATDVRDISARLVRCLTGETDDDGDVPAILIAEELTPSDTLRLDKNNLLAIVTVRGSVNSHTSILARTMNIPALISVPLALDDLRSGMTAIVDGERGEVIFEPDEATLKSARQTVAARQAERQALARLKGLESVTRDGRKMEICANIGGVGDITAVLENDADGIGLFRSEFLYLGRTDLPGEEEQLAAYRQVLEALPGKKVVIRTLDIGADKQTDALPMEPEDNPALGCRAIRLCLTRPDIFKTQLRALLRAAVYGDLHIMYPMIISCTELDLIAALVDEVSAELKQAGIPYRVPPQGIMIETPAAVMISDQLAKKVDFFSVGTNDLSQYTLALDRQNDRLAEFFDPHHEAILREVRIAADNAHAAGIWIGICGELGADPALTDAFLNMGIDELSVPPAAVLPLRRRIREM